METQPKTIRELFMKALKVKDSDISSQEIHLYLIDTAHDIGHWKFDELITDGSYELKFETGEKIVFDGTDYYYRHR
jgi:hypothetical protein